LTFFAIFVIVIIFMSVLIALKYEKINKQKCKTICQDNNKTFLGMTGGKCVCSCNVGVRTYFEIGDNQVVIL